MIIIIYLLTIYKAAIIQCIDIVHLQCHFGEPLFFFFCLYFIYIYIYIYIYIVILTQQISQLLRCKAQMCVKCFCTVHLQCHFVVPLFLFFFFLSLPFVLFFFFIYTVILTQQISQYFHNYRQCFGNVHLMSSYSA